MEVSLDSSNSIKNFTHYLKCLNKISTALVLQCTEDALNLNAISSSMSSCLLISFPAQAFQRFQVTDPHCLHYGRKLTGTELTSFVNINGSLKSISSLLMTFTPTRIILTLKPEGSNLAEKVVKFNFEQVQFMVPRRPVASDLACQIISLPRPWLMAFDMITALRSLSTIHDIRLDVMPSAGVVVRTEGRSCSRTLIESTEFYSIRIQTMAEDQVLSFLVSFKEFMAAFELASQLASTVNLSFDRREGPASHADPGPLIMKIPSALGIEAEFIISALIPEGDEEPVGVDTGDVIPSGTSIRKPTAHVSVSDVDHVSESDLSPLDEEDAFEIPGTPPRDLIF